jgi:predicted metalloprotease with PDZ domain
MANTSNTEHLEDAIAALWRADPREFRRRTPEIVSAIHVTRTPWSRVFDRLAETSNPPPPRRN